MPPVTGTLRHATAPPFYMSFLFYDQTGCILQTGECPAPEFEHQRPGPGCKRLQGQANLTRDYVDLSGDDPVVRERPALRGFDKTRILADDTDTATLRDLPSPCTVLVNGVAHTVTGGELALSCHLPIRLTVVIDAFPYLPFQEVVTCVSPSA